MTDVFIRKQWENPWREHLYKSESWPDRAASHMNIDDHHHKPREEAREGYSPWSRDSTALSASNLQNCERVNVFLLEVT